MSQIGKEIERASKIIAEGGVVAFPTETVYGLGADALNPKAVAKIFSYKERPTFDPLIVHISTLEQLKIVLKRVDDNLLLLANKFWPGPLTIVTKKSDNIPDIVTSGLDTVGVRMPSNPIALKFIEACATPIAAPSANKFGKISPTLASHVRKELPDIDMVIDGGGCEVGIESTVIALDSDGFHILREGAITFEELQKVLPSVAPKNDQQPLAPGMLKSHYSPRKPLFIADSYELDEIEKQIVELKHGGKCVAFISFTGIAPKEASVTHYLSKNADLKEAALNLFRILHLLEDDSEVDIMVAEEVRGEGLAKAIMDRLERASYHHTL